MRNLVVTEFVSLDGVMENPGWTFPYWNDAIAAFKGEESTASDALLLGRVTYQGSPPLGRRARTRGGYFNGVASMCVDDPGAADWNNSSGSVGTSCRDSRLKQQPAGTSPCTARHAGPDAHPA
jgi:hypothetical protein